jgi:hypothetical protein
MTDASAAPSYAELSAELRKLARPLAECIVAVVTPDTLTVDRAVINLLHTAFLDAIRQEWYSAAKEADLESHLAVAREWMKTDGYGDHLGDPVCGLPGLRPYICTVDGKEAVCIDMLPHPLTPLSAIYTNKVREAVEIAEKVSVAVAMPGGSTAMKEKRATEILNVQLAVIRSALTVIKSSLGNSEHPAQGIIDTALERCSEACDALATIQFHSSKI